MDADPVEEVLTMARQLPARAVVAVFQRYGKPLADELPPIEAEDQRAELTLDDGARVVVRVLNVRTPVDVIGNDWFILQGEEALAVPAPLFAAALAALARAASKKPDES
jgi:hypothetical protein